MIGLYMRRQSNISTNCRMSTTGKYMFVKDIYAVCPLQEGIGL